MTVFSTGGSNGVSNELFILEKSRRVGVMKTGFLNSVDAGCIRCFHETYQVWQAVPRRCCMPPVIRPQDESSAFCVRARVVLPKQTRDYGHMTALSAYIRLPEPPCVMEPRQIVETIFSVDKNIRYVGVVSSGPDYDIKASRIREGVESLTPEEKEREFIQIIPEIIVGLAEKLEDDLGKIRYSLLCFPKLTLMLFRTAEYVVILSLQAGTFARPIYERIKPLLGLER